MRNPTTTAVIIGGGPAGLVMSHELGRAGVDHVVVERGRIAERWRSERWDSLRLLTPNWLARFPGWSYTGPDPSGFMTMPEVVEHLAGYATSFDAPVWEHTTVERVTPTEEGFSVRTTAGQLTASAVVVATGACDTPRVPDWGPALPRAVHQVPSARYRNPDSLPDGGVLVVGASASGIQIASELARAGRPVTLAVGRHTRLPRRYRGMDIHWWLDASGVLDTRLSEVPDPEAARREPSLQLVGSPDGRSVDLATVAGEGVRVVGRARSADGPKVDVDDDLARHCASADARLARLLDRFDRYAKDIGVDAELLPPQRPAPIRFDGKAQRLDLRREGISTVLWATGFRREYPWLDVPVLDERGELRHDGGVTPWPGLYTIGLPFLRRRKSTFLDGFGPDAAELTEHLLEHLAAGRRGPHAVKAV